MARDILTAQALADVERFIDENPDQTSVKTIAQPLGGWTFSNPSDPNWIATVGPMVFEYARRYTAKVAELRKTDLRIDWSEVIGVDGPRRIALRHTELIDRPV